MALPKLDDVQLHYLDLWFANLVDTINYDLGKIEDEVPTLDMVLTNVDTAPIQYLKDSLDELIKNLNDGFEEIDRRLSALESKYGNL